MTKSSFEINSLVERLVNEKKISGSTQRNTLASLDGYIGPTDKNLVRIYSGLDLGQYVDIQESEIVHVTYASKNPEDACRVFFKSDCELKYVRTATFKASDAIESRTASGSGCSCGGDRRVATAARLDNGPELPPQNCELKCEMTRNVCEEFGMGWCNLSYYTCRLGCIYGDVFGGVGGVGQIRGVARL